MRPSEPGEFDVGRQETGHWPAHLGGRWRYASFSLTVEVRTGAAEPAPAGEAGVTGVLLVGGASRRFGSPKALARLGGKTLGERAWETLGWCDERVAVGKSADALPLPFPVHDDGSLVRAPLAGLVAGLRLASHDIVLALPVDCPLATPDVLRKLVAACNDAAVPQTGPLPGAYRRRVLPLFERRLSDGELALRGALAALAVRVVPLDPRALANVNSKEDLEALEPQVTRAAREPR